MPREGEGCPAACWEQQAEGGVSPLPNGLPPCQPTRPVARSTPSRPKGSGSGPRGSSAGTAGPQGRRETHQGRAAAVPAAAQEPARRIGGTSRRAKEQTRTALAVVRGHRQSATQSPGPDGIRAGWEPLTSVKVPRPPPSCLEARASLGPIWLVMLACWISTWRRRSCPPLIGVCSPASTVKVRRGSRSSSVSSNISLCLAELLKLAEVVWPARAPCAADRTATTDESEMLA